MPFLMMRILLILLCCFTSVATIGQTAQEEFEKANLLFAGEKYKQALSAVETAIEKDQNEADFWVLKGECHFELQQYQEAFDTYGNGLKAFPKSGKLYISMGYMLVLTGDVIRGIEYYDKALEIAEPTDSVLLARAYGMRGNARYSTQDYELAASDVEKAISYDDDDIANLNNLALCYMSLKRYDETLVLQNKVYAMDSSYFFSPMNIGFTYQEMGDYEAAAPYFEKALELSPDNPLCFNNRGYNRLILGDTKGALSDVNKSIKLFPENSYAYRNRGLVYLKMDKKDKACEDWKKAIELGFTGQYGPDVV